MRSLFPTPAFGLAAAALVSAPIAAQTGNAGHGHQLFLQCRACHTAEPAAPSGVGPNLSGVVGRAAGSLPGYSYSPAMAKSGLIWNAASLDVFIKRPSAAVPGTKMGFSGVGDAQSRADIIAYLTTLAKPK